jgi:MoaA/NifB/PqqE/SkfB family radical SAM enzyme
LDPLTHPHLERAVETAAGLGYTHIHLYSPSTRYAEAEFLDSLLAACGPMARTFHVPLYGPTSEIHDAVTGRPGSFDQVLAGVAALTERGQGDRIIWLSVVTGSNAPHWPETLSQMRKHPAPIQVLLPFPATRATDDAFYTAATTHQEAIYALAGGGGEIEGLAEILPCVRYRFERRHGAPTLTEGPFHPVTALSGTLFEHADYRRVSDGASEGSFTIPTRACPHHERCALASLCPRGVYEAYASRFGLDELRPVSPSDLDALGFRL